MKNAFRTIALSGFYLVYLVYAPIMAEAATLHPESLNLKPHQYEDLILSKGSITNRMEILAEYVYLHPSEAEPWIVQQLEVVATNGGQFHMEEIIWEREMFYNFTTQKSEPRRQRTTIEIEIIRKSGTLLSKKVALELLKIVKNGGVPFEVRAEAVSQLESYAEAAIGKPDKLYRFVKNDNSSTTNAATPSYVSGSNPKLWPEGLKAIKEGLQDPGIATNKVPRLGLIPIAYYNVFDIPTHVQNTIRDIEEFERTVTSSQK